MINKGDSFKWEPANQDDNDTDDDDDDKEAIQSDVEDRDDDKSAEEKLRTQVEEPDKHLQFSSLQPRLLSCFRHKVNTNQNQRSITLSNFEVADLYFLRNFKGEEKGNCCVTLELVPKYF